MQTKKKKKQDTSPLRGTSNQSRNFLNSKLHSSKQSRSNIRASSVSPNRALGQAILQSPKKGAVLQKIVERVKKGKKKQKKKKLQKDGDYPSDLKELRPLNLAKEKQIFWDTDFSYNPIFLYNLSGILPQTVKPHQKYLSLAIKILECSRALDYQAKFIHSQTLNIQQTAFEFQRYINDHDLASLVRFQFAEHTIAPTSVIHNNVDCVSKVVIGLPIQYKENTVRGVLNHQIGTHFFRKHNDRLQRWHKQRKKFGMKPYLKHEQGLAAINQFIQIAMQENSIPLLFPSALHYYSCYMAHKLTFAQLFKDLQKYQSNHQLRWKQCTRVKRGIGDTSYPGGMHKDQIYLRGAVSVLKHRKQLDLVQLHCGKMSVKDCLRLQKGLIREEGCKLPTFLRDLQAYKRGLDRIASANFIDEFLRRQ